MTVDDSLEDEQISNGRRNNDNRNTLQQLYFGEI